MLDIGNFDRKIKIQSSAISKDLMGGQTYVWEDWHTCYSNVDFQSGGANNSEDKLNSSQTVKFTIRNVGDSAKKINANGMRVLYPLDNGNAINSETQYYSIVGVSEYGGRSKWKILETEIRPNNYKQP